MSNGETACSRERGEGKRELNSRTFSTGNILAEDKATKTVETILGGIYMTYGIFLRSHINSVGMVNMSTERGKNNKKTKNQRH